MKKLWVNLFFFRSNGEIGLKGYAEATFGQLTSIIAEAEMDGYDLSKVPREDLEYAKKQGTGFVKELAYLFKKFNNFTNLFKAVGRLKWKPKDTTKLKVIEEKDAFAIKLRMSLLSYCLASPFMGLGALAGAAIGGLVDFGVLETENLNFMSKEENETNHKFILDAYDDYIAVLEDLVKQAKKKGEKGHEAKFKDALTNLEKGRDKHLRLSNHI